MSQEDDLRALAKIMDFLRAVSIILVVMNVYWYCYSAIRLWGVDIGVVDRILMNFNRTAGLFHSILYTKLFAVLLLALSCLGTKGVKGEKITWSRIWAALAAGSVLFFLNWWISFFNMRCLRSPVAILTAFFFRQNPILSLISWVSRRGRRLELSYLGWMVSKSLKASSGLSVRMADSYSERILSTV